MKRILLTTMMVACALMGMARENMNPDGKPKAWERRALKGFERIELLGSLDVKYRQADTFSVWVEAPRERIRYVETRVDGNKLVVNMKGAGKVINFGIASSDDVTVHVTSPDFLGIELKGSGDFDAKGHLDTDNLTIRLRGSGDVEFDDVICDRVDLSLVGSGDIEVKKLVTQRTDIEVVGSGDVDIKQQKARQTTVVLKGSGDVTMGLDNCGTVSASVFGSGDIKLRGTVQKLTKQSRGSGDIDTRRLTVRQR